MPLPRLLRSLPTAAHRRLLPLPGASRAARLRQQWSCTRARRCGSRCFLVFSRSRGHFLNELSALCPPPSGQFRPPAGQIVRRRGCAVWYLRHPEVRVAVSGGVSEQATDKIEEDADWTSSSRPTGYTTAKIKVGIDGKRQGLVLSACSQTS